MGSESAPPPRLPTQPRAPGPPATSAPSGAAPVDLPEDAPSLLGRAALAFTGWSERYVPDAFVFALIATIFVFIVGALVGGAGPLDLVDAWGRGFWELLGFTLQMALVIITGSVLASTPPALACIRALAGLPKNPRAAVALVTVFALLSAWLNWGFSLIFSAVLAREVARRVRGVDYRALAAASFLGLGSVWAQGLSGSAALQMATPEALSKATREIVAAQGLVPGGLISFRHTIFLWQSFVTVAVELVVVTAIMWFATPPPSRAKTAEALGIDLETRLKTVPGTGEGPPEDGSAGEHGLGARLERSPIVTLPIVLLGGTWLVHYFARAADGIQALNLNVLNLAFLMLGFALHRTPARLMRAVREATPSVWGVILQFPFYAGIAGMITYTHLGERIAHAFVAISTPTTFPPLIALYSMVLGVFVPSGGSKWVIEAPYVMQAAHGLKVHLGWMVAVYDLGEALANLVQPFWMLPTLALFGLRARDVMGYTFVVFVVLTPLVLIMVTLLGLTLGYPLHSF